MPLRGPDLPARLRDVGDSSVCVRLVPEVADLLSLLECRLRSLSADVELPELGARNAMKMQQ